jgi:hypothetical protein
MVTGIQTLVGHHYFIAKGRLPHLSVKRPSIFAEKSASSFGRCVFVLDCPVFTALGVIHILLSVAYADNGSTQ